MTNDQFPMTNGGGRTKRAANSSHSIAMRDWSLTIGIWSLPRITREGIHEFRASTVSGRDGNPAPKTGRPSEGCSPKGRAFLRTEGQKDCLTPIAS